MTGKESFLLIKNKIIFNSKEYKKDCEFVNFVTGQRINCRYVVAQVEKDLEQLELIKKNDDIAKKLNQLEKIKAKTHLLYGQREAIAKEYINWCEKNKAVLTDPTNMVTWLLSIKLKEWLNDKH